MSKQICKRCVMDNQGDSLIEFLEDGTCNYCNYALERIDLVYFPNEAGKQKIEKMVAVLKKEGQGKKYDCLMGLSGGLDSSYLAYLGAKKWGLRILAVHIDDGFDAQIAQDNIKSLCEVCGIDLIIEKPKEEAYMDLIKSFIRAEVPSIAIPQDNVLQACLRDYAKKYNLHYFLSGANFALESILQRGNGHVAADGKHVHAIHRQFGEKSLEGLPLITLFDRYIGQKYISKIKTFRPLDYIDYQKDKALQELEKNAGFRYYGGKHYESIFTKFVQVYYLPTKFGVDKRKSHYSSLIITNQMTRDEALKELETPLYDEKQMEIDIAFILEKIHMSKVEFEELMSRQGKAHSDYKMSIFNHFANIARRFRKVLGE